MLPAVQLLTLHPHYAFLSNESNTVRVAGRTQVFRAGSEPDFQEVSIDFTLPVQRENTLEDGPGTVRSTLSADATFDEEGFLSTLEINLLVSAAGLPDEPDPDALVGAAQFHMAFQVTGEEPVMVRWREELSIVGPTRSVESEGSLRTWVTEDVDGVPGGTLFNAPDSLQFLSPHFDTPTPRLGPTVGRPFAPGAIGVVQARAALSLMDAADQPVEMRVRVYLEFGDPEEPVPETARWINPAGGSFSDPDNWEDGRVPGPEDTAVFNVGVGATYTVSFGSSVENAAVQVIGSNVTFDLNGRIYDLTGGGGGGFDVEVLEGRLSVRDGTIQASSVHTDVDGGLTVGQDALVQALTFLADASSGDLVVDRGHLSVGLAMEIRRGLGVVRNGGQLSVGALGVPPGFGLRLAGDPDRLVRLDIVGAGSQLTAGRVSLTGANNLLIVQDGTLVVVRDETLLDSEEGIVGPSAIVVRGNARYNSPEGGLVVRRGDFRVQSGSATFFKDATIGGDASSGSLELTNGRMSVFDVLTLTQALVDVRAGATLTVGRATATGTDGVIAAGGPHLVRLLVTDPGSTLNARSIDLVGADHVLVVSSGGTVVNSGATSVNVQSDLGFDGVLVQEGGSFQSPSGQLSVVAGRFEVNSGATAHLSGVQVRAVAQPASIAVDGDGSRLTVDAEISVSGDALDGLIALRNGGRIVAGAVVPSHRGRVLIAGGRLESATGTVNGGVVFLEGSGSSWQATGTIRVGDLEAPVPSRLRNNGLMRFNLIEVLTGAVVDGTGLFQGSRFVLGGEFRPGTSPGIATLDVAEFVIAPAGVLVMEVGGHTPGAEHDQIVVTGTATLGGTLRIVVTNGFVPAPGQSIRMLIGGATAGAFAATEVIGAPGGTFQVASGPDGLVVVAAEATARDRVAPVVLSFRRLGVHARPTRLVLAFGEPLQPARAEDTRNYRLVGPGRDGRFGTRDDRAIPLRSASYDPDQLTVTLRPWPRLPFRRRFLLAVNDPGATGISDLAANLLDGDGDGLSGGPYVAVFRGYGVDPTYRPGIPRPAGLRLPIRRSPIGHPPHPARTVSLHRPLTGKASSAPRASRVRLPGSPHGAPPRAE